MVACVCSSPVTEAAVWRVPSQIANIQSALNAADDDDTCSCTMYICNPGTHSLGTLPVFAILDVYGTYFFAPDFSSFAHYTREITPGLQTIEVLPSFAWPSGAGAASGINWYAGITDAAYSTLIGDFGFFTFGWH